jgi:hypothetical protein
MALLRQALVAAFAVAPFCVTVCSAADPPGRNLAQHVGEFDVLRGKVDGSVHSATTALEVHSRAHLVSMSSLYER